MKTTIKIDRNTFVGVVFRKDIKDWYVTGFTFPTGTFNDTCEELKKRCRYQTGNSYTETWEEKIVLMRVHEAKKYGFEGYVL